MNSYNFDNNEDVMVTDAAVAATSDIIINVEAFAISKNIPCSFLIQYHHETLPHIIHHQRMELIDSAQNINEHMQICILRSTHCSSSRSGGGAQDYDYSHTTLYLYTVVLSLRLYLQFFELHNFSRALALSNKSKCGYIYITLVFTFHWRYTP